MCGAFNRVVDELPDLMRRLRLEPARPWGEWTDVPKRGVYLLLEDDRPVYIGRSDNILRRLRQHGNAKSPQNQASLAFNLAKRDALARGDRIAAGKRDDVQHDPAFKPLFERAKERIRRMSFQAVEIADPVTQTLFEVYAHMELGTELNDFRNH